MPAEEKLKARLLSAERIFDCPVFDVMKEHYRLASGKEAVRMVVKHPGAVVMLPQQSDGLLLMVRQDRCAVGEALLEFPAGTLEKGEEPLACAKRELAEEAGQRAAEWVDLGWHYPAPGFCSEKQYCFLARDLNPASLAADEDENISVELFTVAEVEELIRQGFLRDAKSIAIFFKARLLNYL